MNANAEPKSVHPAERAMSVSDRTLNEQIAEMLGWTYSALPGRESWITQDGSMLPLHSAFFFRASAIEALEVWCESNEVDFNIWHQRGGPYSILLQRELGGDTLGESKHKLLARAICEAMRAAHKSEEQTNE